MLYSNLNEDVSKRSIQCLPKGEPNAYTYFQWEHVSEFHEHIRYLKARDDGILYLPYVDISNRYQDTGFYICNVSNGVPDYHGNIFQQGREFIVSEGNQFSVRYIKYTHYLCMILLYCLLCTDAFLKTSLMCYQYYTPIDLV